MGIGCVNSPKAAVESEVTQPHLILLNIISAKVIYFFVSHFLNIYHLCLSGTEMFHCLSKCQNAFICFSFLTATVLSVTGNCSSNPSSFYAIRILRNTQVKHPQLKRGNMSFASFALESLWEFEKRFGRVQQAERFTEGGCDVSQSVRCSLVLKRFREKYERTILIDI